MHDVGTQMSRFPFADLRKVRDLEYYEGPLLSEYKAASGDVYLFLWRETDKAASRWLAFRTNRRSVTLFVNQRLTLLEMIKAARMLFLVDRLRGTKESVARVLDFEDLPLQYRPKEGSLYDPDLAPDDAVPTSHGIVVDKQISWDVMGDLRRKYRDVYAFQYVMRKKPDAPPKKRLSDRMESGYVYYHLFEALAKKVPSQQRAELRELHYASPGVIELEVDSEIAALVPKAIARFRDDQAKERITKLRDALQAWQRAQTKAKTQDNPTQVPWAMTRLREFCDALGFLDYETLLTWDAGKLNLVKFVLAYHTRVEALVDYEDQLEAKVL